MAQLGVVPADPLETGPDAFGDRGAGPFRVRGSLAPASAAPHCRGQLGGQELELAARAVYAAGIVLPFGVFEFRTKLNLADASTRPARGGRAPHPRRPTHARPRARPGARAPPPS